MKKIFLSYSSKAKNSIEKLLKDLSKPKDYELWVDKKLSGGEQWWDEILNRIRACDIFVLALSEESCDSVACKQEYLYARSLGKHILPIFVGDNVRLNLLPPELITIQYINYCNPDTDDAIDLITSINSFPPSKPLPDPLPEAPKVPVKSKERSVFLGNVTDDLTQERISVKNYLNQYGIYVLPHFYCSLDATVESNNLGICTEKDLPECAVFVQLLSGNIAEKSVDFPSGYLQLQYDIARKFGKPIIQWRSPYLDISSIQDHDHRTFVSGDTVRAESIEDFKRNLKDFVMRPPSIKESKLKEEDFVLKSPLMKEDQSKTMVSNLDAVVFVNMDSSDRSLAEKVCRELHRHGIGYSLPLSDGDPADIRKDLEYNLVESTGIIIIYGRSTAVWVRRQLMEFRKILQKRERPIQAFAIFEGPPEVKHSIDMMFPNLKLLDLKKGMDDTLLDKEISLFIENLVKENP
ncbi:MAG: toll/interleukin-1 receptor domain-containing protein [Pelodictyon phaeoclathratiforme]